MASYCGMWIFLALGCFVLGCFIQILGVGRFDLGRWVISANFQSESFRPLIVLAKMYVSQWFDCHLPGCGGFAVYFPAECRELH